MDEATFGAGLDELAPGLRGEPGDELDDLIIDAQGRAFIEFTLEVGPGSEGYRLDRFLSRRFTRLSRTRIHKMIAAGGVRCHSSGAPLGKNALRLRNGQVLRIRRPAPSPSWVTTLCLTVTPRPREMSPFSVRMRSLT